MTLTRYVLRNPLGALHGVVEFVDLDVAQQEAIDTGCTVHVRVYEWSGDEDDPEDGERVAA